MNASENPFASARVEKLPFRFRPGDSWEQFFKRLEDQRYCGAIVGPHGSGKSTMLEALIPHLKERGFEPVVVRLTAESSMRDKERLPDIFRRLVKPQFILLDGAEQLSTRHWLPARSAASNAAGFVVSVYRVSRLPVVMHIETHVPLFKELVEELTGGSIPYEECASLMARHHGNVREAFRELHERWDGGASEPEEPEEPEPTEEPEVAG